MQVVEFQPKLSSVISNKVYTIDELKAVIMQIVSGPIDSIGTELSQPRLAEIMVKMLDLGVSNSGSGGSGSGSDVAAFTLQGNATNANGPVLALTVQQVISILSEFQASGPNHMKGLVPDPGDIAGTTKFLREDGGWQVPPGGGGGGTTIGEVEVDNTIIRYQVVSGTPIVTASRVPGTQTISTTGGVIKLISVATKGGLADLSSNAFSIVCNGVVGTGQLAYPVVQKWGLTGAAPDPGAPHVADVDNTPQVQIIAGTAGTSITIRIVNLNGLFQWVIKMVW